MTKLKHILYKILIVCGILSFVFPVGVQAVGASSDFYFQQRKVCTDSYYYTGRYLEAADCYRQAWGQSCSYDADACLRAKNNIWLAMDNYRTQICNNYYFQTNYSKARDCYQVGITYTCNSNPNFDDLCSKNRSNLSLATNPPVNYNDTYYSNSYPTSSYYPTGTVYTPTINYSSQIQQLSDYKANCNQNYYNGNIYAFRDCSRNGANLACSIPNSEGSNLCNAFNNNVALADNTINNVTYWRNNNCFTSDYRYNNCTNAPVSETVQYIALGLAGVTVICALAGCFN